MQAFLGILKYIKAYQKFAYLNAICNILTVIFSLFSITMIVPFLQLLFDKKELQLEQPAFTWSVDGLKDYFNYFLSSMIAEDKTQALLFVCGLVIVSFLLRNLFRYLAAYFMSPIRNGVVRDIRTNVYAKINRLPASYFSEEKKGDLMARITSDVQEIEWSIMRTLEMLVREPLNIIVFLGAMLYISPQLTLFVFITLPIAGFVIGKIGKSLRKTSFLAQNQLGQLMSIIEETLGGVKIIQAFNAESSQADKFSQANDQHYRLMTEMIRRKEASSPISEVLSIVALVFVLYFGAQMVLHEQALEAEIFIYFMVIFSQIIPPAKNFARAYNSIQKGMASVDRIEEILAADEKIKSLPNALPIKDFSSAIQLQDVNFAYDKEPILEQINLDIQKGQSIALVGPSGAGKSTLVDLLPRFQEVTAGQILIDGQDIRKLQLQELRSLFGIVTQEPILFNDTIFHNIAFGHPNASKEAVIQAAKVANAHDFISQLEQGYETNIGDRGSKLSGGERQRLTIARAVLNNPPILILDEATSSLDAKSERLVQDALARIMENRTAIIIAHRLSTIKNADQIIVLQDGKIVEQGTHDSLLLQDQVYKKLTELQTFS